MASQQSLDNKDSDALARKRNHWKGRLTSLRKKLNQFSEENCSNIFVEEQIDAIKEIWKNYKLYQNELEMRDTATASDRDEFEKNVNASLIEARNLLRKINEYERTLIPETVTNQLNTSVSLITPSNIELPKLELPRFSGNADEWHEFFQMYCSMVHSNDRISVLHKNHYLRQCLDGPAADLIRSIPVTDVDYKTAIQMLRDRYDRPDRTVKLHVAAIFELEVIKRADAESLEKLYSSVCDHLRVISSKGELVQHWDPMLLHIVTSKLDTVTRTAWETHISMDEKVTFEKLKQFLLARCRVLAAIPQDRSRPAPLTTKSTFPPQRFRNAHAFTENYQEATPNYKTCIKCKEERHPLFKCQEFRKLTVDEKIKFVQINRHCFNCLAPTHTVAGCNSQRRCFECGEKHNTLLHRHRNSNLNRPQPENTNRNFEPRERPNNNNNKGKNGKPVEKAQSYNHNSMSNRGATVLLSTAIVKVRDDAGKWQEIRCLLDSGATHDFITKEAASRLNLKLLKTGVQISGINKKTTEAQNYANVKIKSNNGIKFMTSLSCLIIDVIGSDVPSNTFSINNWKIPKTVKLADPDFNKRAPVEMLLSAETFWRVLLNNKIKIAYGVYARKTMLGWIITGKVHLPWRQKCQSYIANEQLESSIERLWQLDRAHVVDKLAHNYEEVICERYYETTTSRKEDGRFIVSMPRKENYDIVDHSKQTALNRLYSLESRLARQPLVREQYNSFMNEYEALDHMEVVTREEDENYSYETNYLSHHPVWKDEVKKEKIRVVFNGSSPDRKGNTFNDSLLIGPPVETDLFKTITNFRLHEIAVCADIEKMYRQILIEEKQTHLQRILWRSDPNKPIKIFRLKTVTYGLKPSAQLAIRTLTELADQDGHLYRDEVANALKNNFYVDDYLQSFQDVETAKSVSEQLSQLLKKGGFFLRSWCSNNKKFIKTKNQDEIDLSPIEIFKEDTTVKTLGMHWCPLTDSFTYKIKFKTECKYTKRTILSEIASIFDPLNYLSPVIITAKIFMQKLWELKTDWDKEVPTDLKEQWIKYRNSLVDLEKISIPRKLCPGKTIQTPDLHVFCDASEMGYGCSAYVVSGNKSSLVCSKSRVAPLKAITLPRLELCGAVLAVELAEKLKEIIQIKIRKTIFWTDSKVVLAWIAKPSRNWTTFVANRVQKIQQVTTPEDWFYVRSEDNPADVISRGTSPARLNDHALYWGGPAWLCEGLTPESPLSSHAALEDVPETRKQAVIFIANQATGISELANRFSKLNTLIRVIAYVTRWKSKVIDHKSYDSTLLSSQEIKEATNKIIKMTQKEHFYKEYDILSKGDKILQSSKLAALSPFIDKEGIIRVGGRLQQSKLPYKQKHQAILPKKSHVTNLIIQHFHTLNLHAGSKALLYIIRENYWPINGQRTVNSAIYGCIKCIKTKLKPSQQLMGDLPYVRTAPQRPFNVTGVDYAGPILFNAAPLKSKKHDPQKAYIALFICMVTGAIHLELATSASAQHFLAALRRFISRRGKPDQMYSDNGANFQSISSEINKAYNKEKFNEQIQKFSNENSITWHFIPPYSPNFGGRWESHVKIVKRHLQRTIGKSILQFEELNTLLIQIEAIVNSRPISPISSDPDDLMPLTPAHFLIGRSLTSLPESVYQNKRIPMEQNWKATQSLRAHFWKRWKSEYLNNLQRREKWTNEIKNINVGDLVMVRDPSPPLVWKMGRVLEVFVGKDNLARVAKLKTGSGQLVRSVNLLAPLPITIAESER